MRWSSFNINEADAICKLMNFARAERSFYGNRVGIQNDYDTIKGYFDCMGPVWESCTYHHTHNKYYVFLSCTGNFGMVESKFYCRE